MNERTFERYVPLNLINYKKSFFFFWINIQTVTFYKNNNNIYCLAFCVYKTGQNENMLISGIFSSIHHFYVGSETECKNLQWIEIREFPMSLAFPENESIS